MFAIPGIDIAKLAGLPDDVIDLAKVFLEKLETNEEKAKKAAKGTKIQERRRLLLQVLHFTSIVGFALGMLIVALFRSQLKAALKQARDNSRLDGEDLVAYLTDLRNDFIDKMAQTMDPSEAPDEQPSSSMVLD
jgi:hypothetical protein